MLFLNEVVNLKISHSAMRIGDKEQEDANRGCVNWYLLLWTAGVPSKKMYRFNEL